MHDAYNRQQIAEMKMLRMYPSFKRIFADTIRARGEFMGVVAFAMDAPGKYRLNLVSTIPKKSSMHACRAQTTHDSLGLFQAPAQPLRSLLDDANDLSYTPQDEESSFVDVSMALSPRR